MENNNRCGRGVRGKYSNIFDECRDRILREAENGGNW